MAVTDELSGLFGKKNFGMDFGTYRSVLAYKGTGDQPRVPTYRNENLGGVPSLYWYTADGRELVGDQVLQANGAMVDPAGVCSSVKMKLGQSITLNGKTFTATEIAVKLMKRILEVSRLALEQDFVGMDFDVLVVGAPARFWASLKGEIESISIQATGGKKIRVVPEPILAAVANDYFNQRMGKGMRTTLVYDLGAGTFDVTLLKPNPDRTYDNPYLYEACTPDGLPLAGDDLDEAMVELLLDIIRRNPGGLDLSVLENRDHHDHRRLRLIARDVKENLSSVPEYTAIISGVECGSGLVTVRRSDYESRIRPLLKQTVDLTAAVMKKNGLTDQDDVDLLLVGGSTYIPLVRTMLEEAFPGMAGRIYQRLPEKAVALGAAIYAEQPEVVLPKVAYGYAVPVYNQQKKRRMLYVCIPSNAKLPMTVTHSFATRFDKQNAVDFQIYEVDEGQSEECLEMSSGKKLGREYGLEHSFGKAVPAHTSVKLTTTLDENGVLHMEVDDLGVSGSVSAQTFRLTNVEME